MTQEAFNNQFDAVRMEQILFHDDNSLLCFPFSWWIIDLTEYWNKG